MKKAALIIISVIFLFSSCALEIANVIGPGGGYVFYDKGNYDGGWRYIQCSSFDFGELKAADLKADEDSSIKKQIKLGLDHTGGWQTFPWELPSEAQLKKMLECFSYGLTRFSPDFYYLAVNDLVVGNEADPSSWSWKDVVILHKNFDEAMNGIVEIVNVEDVPDVIKIRPIQKF
jgi:hypothetical protein